MKKMKFMEVGCAIIRHKGKILIAQRNPGDSFGGYWEFPGGKCRKDETMEACLRREIQEELGLCINPTQFLCNTKHVYPQKKISLHFYLCDWVHGTPVKHDCFDFRWVEPKELRKFMFPRGDEDIINELITHQHRYFRR